MFTVLSNTRNASLYMITALAIMIVVLLTFAFIPSISVKEPAASAESSSQNAYAEYLIGEKVLYENPARLSEALAAYRLGEKAEYTSAMDAGSALSAYIAGEKVIYANSADLDAALAAWRAGEKTIFQAGDLETALWLHRMGEKGLQ